MSEVLKEFAYSDEKSLTLAQYVVAQTEAAKRGQWLADDIAAFTEDDKELVWDVIRQLMMREGLAEVIDGVSSAARVVRKQHPDEATRNKASAVEDALDKLSEEVGPAFGTWNSAD